MYYIYPQIILAFTIALYLYDRYIRQEVKNLTTLGLIIGFINLALVGLIQFIISTNLLLWDYKILYFLRYLFLVSALVFVGFPDWQEHLVDWNYSILAIPALVSLGVFCV